MDTAEKKRIKLPYVDNYIAVLISIVINLVVVFIFNWPGGISYFGVLLDTATCVVITVIVNMIIIYILIKRMKAQRSVPRQVPISSLMQKLPKNPVVLAVIYIVFFGVVTVAINAVVLWFFGMNDLNFITWLVYKLIYTTVLSIKVVEYCIFRFVQPDWTNEEERESEDLEAAGGKPIKDPLPKISVFKEMYGSVTANIGMNMILGAFLGSVTVGVGSVVSIAPTTIGGIPISGLVFGLITGFLVSSAIIKSMRTGILNAAALAETSTENAESVPTETPAGDRRFTWMPKRRLPLTALICVAVMIFSYFALPTLMWLFGREIMSFYQSIIFMTVYASLLSKPLVYILTKRCTQPDYAQYVVKSKKAI